MKAYNKSLLLLLMAGFSLTVSGQIFNQDEKDLIVRGDRLFMKGQYINAEAVYAELERENPDNIDIMRRLGVVKVLNRKYEEAIRILEHVVGNTDSIDYFVTFQLATAHQHTNNFERAADLYHLASTDSVLVKKCEIGIMQSEFALRMQQQKPGNAILERLDTTVNTAGNELAPQLLNDTLLIYRSEAIKPFFSMHLFEKKTGELRYAILNGSDPVLSDSFEFPGKDELSGNNKWLQTNVVLGEARYLYYSNKNRQFGISELCINNNIDGGFQQVDLFDAHEASVVILPGRDVAYYTKSEEVNGLLQKDIYEAERDSAGNWIEMRKLEMPVNSDYNEDFLFWSEEESALYFSSDRRKCSMGGFDVFRSDRDENGNLQQPVNIGFPVNTVEDDIYFSKHGNKVFYASRNGDKNFDIYSVIFKKHISPTVAPLPWYEKYKDLPGIIRIDEWTMCEHIYFETYQTVTDTSTKAYKALCKALIENPGIKVKLTGYADWTGDAEANQKISFQRVANLFFALCKEGVNSNQLKIDFVGSEALRTEQVFEDPILSSLAKEANRCVTIEVIDQGSTYLYVREKSKYKSVLNVTDSPLYAMLVAVEEKDQHTAGKDLDSFETLDVGEFKLFHTPMSSDFIEAIKLSHQYIQSYPEGYMFMLCY